MKNLSPSNETFQNKDSWMVQSLTLATLGLLAILQIAPAIIV